MYRLLKIGDQLGQRGDFVSGVHAQLAPHGPGAEEADERDLIRRTLGSVEMRQVLDGQELWLVSLAERVSQLITLKTEFDRVTKTLAQGLGIAAAQQRRRGRRRPSQQLGEFRERADVRG